MFLCILLTLFLSVIDRLSTCRAPANQKKYFSVRVQGVVEQINRSLGKKVALIYEQHKGLPGTCLGETEYFIVGVRVLD